MTTLSAAIMAHPARKGTALALQSSLDRDVPICWDPNPVPSADTAQRWVTGRAAWEVGLAAGADWHMVLQDDVVACRDLLAGLEVALGRFPKRPTGLMSAYTGTGKPHQGNVRRALKYALDRDHSWMCTRSLNWGLAIIAPTWTIEPMLAWCSRPRWTKPSKEPQNYDYRIGVYYRDVKKWRTWYTVPSLVDHLDGPSLVGHGRGPARSAHRFIGTTGSALDVDWGKVPTRGLEIAT